MDLPERQGLYDPRNEHDSCGVGFIADMKGRKSHQMVADGLQILARLRPIRLLCLDVDGVLSDGHLYFAGGEGDARFCQRFSVRDGVGIRLLMQSGRHVAILSEGNILSGRDRKSVV